MLNHIDLMGRMTRDPELRYTKDGTATCSFTLACDRDYKGEDNARAVDFIDCVIWGKGAEFTSRNFFKGLMTVVSGRLQIREWTDRDGNKRRNAEINCDSIYFGEAKRTSEKPDENRAMPTERQSAAYSELSDTDGELPF